MSKLFQDIDSCTLTEQKFDEYLHSDFICMVDPAIIDDVEAIMVFGIKDGELTFIDHHKENSNMQSKQR